MSKTKAEPDYLQHFTENHFNLSMLFYVAPTPPIIQQQSTDYKSGVMFCQGRGGCAGA